MVNSYQINNINQKINQLKFNNLIKADYHINNQQNNLFKNYKVDNYLVNKSNRF